MNPTMTIDFEASCLPRHGRSFPIEVGIARVQGAELEGNARSWLIRPHASWAGWAWTAEAQALHGLTLEQLHLHGQPVDQVMAELISDTRGFRMVSDSALDSGWLRTLAQASARAVPWRIDHVASLFDELDITSEDIGAAQAMTDRISRRRHRAGDDARWLAGLIAHLQHIAARRLEAESRPIFAWENAPIAMATGGQAAEA